MKRNIKQILSFILVCVMTFGMLPTIAPTEVEAAGEVGTTELFNGNATYLLQERFNGTANNSFGEDIDRGILSGWDIDYRGGNVRKYGDDLIIVDSNDTESITMDHKLMKHTGDGLVLETAFKYNNTVTDGFYYEVSGNKDVSLRLFVEGAKIYIKQAGGQKTQLMNCSANTFYHIKAEFTTSTKKVNIWINGQSVGQFSYLEDATSIDAIKIGTTKGQMAELVLDFVYVYVNYIVNETFMSAPTGKVPAVWSATGGSIQAVPGAPYPADPNGFSLPVNKTLSKYFSMINYSDDNERYSISWEMFIPSSGADGFFVSNEIFNFKADGGTLYVNNEEVYDYTKNVWYKIEIQAYKGTELGENLLDVYINNVKRATIEATGKGFSYISFDNYSGYTVLIDNIFIHKTFEASDFEDYPTVDETPESDTNIGMVVYPMWREGIHYGWDLISPYEERTPYLGYYTGGSREVADWDNKWLLEHGFNHAIFPFARPDITSAGGQPSFSVRGEALHDGYLNSEYKDMLDFAIMLTNPLDESYDSASDFITNVEPYLVEHYFKNPSYKSVNNRLLVYCYNPTGFGTYLGGIDKFADVLDSLNTAVKAIDNGNGGKYDGITFIADVSSGNGVTTFNSIVSQVSFGSYVYKWRYTWGSDQYENIVNGIKNDYATDDSTVASIPMGFDNIPWLYNEVGIIDPAGVQQMCNAVVDYKTSSDPNIIVLTCWDEWGEGHFFSPSKIQGEDNGFDYLNVVRKTFTKSGEKTNEDRPTEDAIRRMGVLYPENRQILKIKKDRVETTADSLAGLTSLGKISVKGTRGSCGGCDYNRTGSWGSYTYKYTVTGSPATVTYSSGVSSKNIDASKITAVRIKGYAQNSSTMVLYLRTSSKDYDTAPKIRLEGKCDGGTTVVDTILYPTNPENFTGTITGMRFNPAANTSNGSEFYLEEVEFYTGKMGTTLTVDDKEVELVSPVQITDTAYIPAYKLLLDLDAYVLWDKPTQTLTVEKDNVTVKIKAGSKTIQANGVNKTLDYAPYYKEGNLFIPYSGVLEEFGYKTKYDTAKSNVGIYSKNYDAIKNYVNDNCWNFNIDGFTEGWSGTNVYEPMTVQNGMMQLLARTGDPQIKIEGLNIPKEKARYAIVRIKKTDRQETGMLRLYDDSTSATGVVYQFTLKPSSNVQEFVFDLTKDATVDSTYTNAYAALSKITKLRLDPMDNLGTVYIDQIKITDELTDEEYRMSAYCFESENMLKLDTSKTGFAYHNTLNSQGTTESDVLPATEAVDGYSNVIKIIPTSGNNEGLLNLEKVYYNGYKQKVEVVANANRVVKVSFWYKGIGNCTALQFENRQSGARDGEEFKIKNISNSQWNYFEEYIDLSNESGTGRWFTLRVTTDGNTATDGIYIRDYSLVCLDETTPVTTIGNEVVAIRVQDLDTNETVDGAKVYLVEYDAQGKMKNATIKSFPNVIDVQIDGSADTENSRYYYYKPLSETAQIKCALWSEFTPLVQQLTITKN